jgi:hypothetical protein
MSDRPLASAALSTNTAWSPDVDEVLGTYSSFTTVLVEGGLEPMEPGLQREVQAVLRLVFEDLNDWVIGMGQRHGPRIRVS